MSESHTIFKTTVSLDLLIDFWRKEKAAGTESLFSKFAGEILQKIERHPEMTGSIADLTILEKNKELLSEMMAPVFAQSYFNTDIRMVCPPFDFKPFYMTDRGHMILNEQGEINYDAIIMGKDNFRAALPIVSYATIVGKLYRLNMNLSYPLIIKIKDEATSLPRYFKLNMDDRFNKVITHGTLPELTKEKLKLISENMLNIDVWKEVLPPEHFELQGFILVHAFEVTEQEALSALRKDLLEEEEIFSKRGIKNIEEKIRTYFRNPNLHIGIAMLPKIDEKNFSSSEVNLEYSLTSGMGNRTDCSCYESSIYENAYDSDKPVIIFDLEDYPGCGKVENQLLRNGFRNVLLKSLYDMDGEPIGLLEVASTRPGEINSINAMKLLEIVPLLSVAIIRYNLEIENKIQSIIKERCTAIHPTVEWRFREAAFNLIEKEKTDEYAQMEEIVFRDVYPLYALSDIRNSSVNRNHAIKEDLKENLKLATDIISTAYSYKKLPMLDQMKFRINKRMEALDGSLQSGDEVSIIKFLHQNIEPMFEHLKGFGEKMGEVIEKYNKAIDPNLGFYYKKRKDYEESVSMINDTISLFVDDEQEKAQEMFPHYFERYKTDGVEYTIYIGDSIARDNKFHRVYLKSIRLWQLMMMCGIVHRASAIKPKLAVPLDTAHLILVQDSPLAIRFHLDQKKFDVDGAYNAHYEIIKKRIDKAEIRGREERLTQPGKLAIVYTQPNEANEYRQYLEYLYTKGYVMNDLEYLELEDLQGVHGLKAMRVSVNMEAKVFNEDVNKSEIERAVKEFAEN